MQGGSQAGRSRPLYFMRSCPSFLEVPRYGRGFPMSIRGFWLFGALLALVYGLAFVFAPSSVALIYGVDYSSPVEMSFQYFGTALVGVGFFCWAARDVTATATQQKLLLAHGVADVLGVGVSLIATIEHTINGLGWFNVALYGALAAACAYLHLRSPVRSTSARAY